jgi:hypothetical protein
MSTPKTSAPKGSAVALWKSIKASEVEDDVEEILSMSEAELDAYLTANGGDPAAIGAAGEALAKELDARADRLSWHGDMQKKLDAVRATAAAKRAGPREALSREELSARIARARNDPRFAARVATLFRSKTPEASTDEELRALLDQIELLAGLGDD